ncbi:MAG: calcium/sodium antiporter [Candidatus Hadarchaeaceae archaeon]
MEEFILYIFAFVAALLLIAKAGDVFVDSACGIAQALGVSQVIIALTLVAFATSAPEFFTSTMAAWFGNVGISYGNVVGSNIINITPILALAAIFGVAQVGRERLAEGVIMLAVGGALAAMALDGEVWWVEGLFLLVIFALFLRFVLRREARRRPKEKTSERERLGRLILLFILGTVGVIIGSRLLIYSGVGIALDVGVPEAAIGFTLVAIGTSIPELATIIISIFKRLPEFSVGTIVGSNIFNTALIIGSAALIRPLTVDSQALWFSNLMMLAAMVILLVFMWRGQRLTRGQGVTLLVFYAFYLVGLAFLYA